MDKVLFDRIRNDYPEIRFRKGVKFLFRPPKTIVLGPEEENDSLVLAHELGHYLCGHQDFKTEIERLKCERQAWEKARELCEKYGIIYDEKIVEAEIDTYRDWLDKKSRCPKCGLTRFQTREGKWCCPQCDL
ncbi:hypothetical protein IJJ39_02475 [Candidatus Saccharibacteria bacterium]|nr:hypothetical protein [Candidatus Saccharibacteria bacterium]